MANTPGPKIPPAIRAYIESQFHISNLNDCLIILPKDISNVSELLHYLPDYTIGHITKDSGSGDLTLNIHKEPPMGLAKISTEKDKVKEKELKSLITTYIDRLKQVVTTTDSKRKISWTQRHFISNLSHQVKTPLNSIISGVQLIEHYVKDEFVHRILEYMLQSSVELTTYINDIVDFYYMKKNDIDLRLESVCIADTLEYITDLYRQQLIDSQIAVDIQIDPDMPETVLLDDKRFTQVVMNLFSNAVKYTEYASSNALGAINQDHSILINVERRTPTLAAITIQDTGTGGINITDQEKYFEPFNQIEMGEDGEKELNGQPIWLDAPDGLGLGLCISRYLISRMGGTIRFIEPPDAEYGYKTAVQVTFPIDLSANNRTNKPVLINVKSAEKTAKLGSMIDISSCQVKQRQVKHVDFVLIDDNQANLELLELIIRDKLALDCNIDFNVAAFSDPYLARDHIMEFNNPCMIVLADIKMPRLNGFALVSSILDQVDSDNRPYFVYITALSASDVMSRVNAIKTEYSGCKLDVVYKPVNIKTLETTIKTIINEIEYSRTEHPVSSRSPVLSGRKLQIAEPRLSTTV